MTSHDGTAAAVAAELVDVVDDDDQVVATVTRGEVRTRRLQHRAVFIVVRRSDGRVLVHQRSAHKDIWPSAWDVAIGGVVGAGESWDAAAARELAEEVGIVGVPLHFVRAGRYADSEVREMGRVYETTWDGELTFADGEVVAARWLTPVELAASVAGEQYCPDSLAMTGDLLR